MRFTSATQLKDWIKNKAKQTGTPSNALLYTYMMERLLERVSVSAYRENFILKGGFLIAAMVGIDRRSTMDMDATAKGLSVSNETLKEIIDEIIAIDVEDGVTLEIENIQNIREVSEYDDFRISLKASFHTIFVRMKLDITTGDRMIPGEIEYSYKLMFEERTIPVMAYNLYTILAEKIETILSRNVTNTRGRDFYDAYMLLSENRDTLSRTELLHALQVKAEERGSAHHIAQYEKHLQDIGASPEVAKIWAGYTKSYAYAKGIVLADILSLIRWVFEG
ncbi:MAG: nucleotidyl transferase AbiEii/AbiGii toxin family protein [Oscillospiraceae bacterium]|nr:nucleotidyl transferase AbiEii/AbiGii toxin family protein [Oscillospiraceae bacterium]